MVLTAWLGMKSWPVCKGQPMLFVTGLVLHKQTAAAVKEDI